MSADFPASTTPGTGGGVKESKNEEEDIFLAQESKNEEEDIFLAQTSTANDKERTLENIINEISQLGATIMYEEKELKEAYEQVKALKEALDENETELEAAKEYQRKLSDWQSKD